ncbi:MAG TPA: glycosyltransferase [Cyclobacteriaceae bacterium]|nr:glycosyltransferase [Cyclobacteriaceae bacterium]
MKSPIVLFVYNRPGHTRLTVDALKKNPESSDSDLIIFSDAPKSARDEASVLNVRNYLREVDGFKSVRIVERAQNFGLSKSIREGVTEILGQYETVIVLEDDLITSPSFLGYMNTALDLYATTEEVISIHAYSYPTKKKLPETFFLRGADCWGWATWRRGWALFETDGAKLLNEIRTRNEVARFNFNNSYPYTSMLEEQIAGRNSSWAILWYASAFVKNKLTLYPGRSLVHNLGNDSSGTHSKATNVYDVDVSDVVIDVVGSKPPLKDNQAAVEIFAGFFANDQSGVDTLKKLAKKILKWT